MANLNPIFRSAFQSADDEFNGQGVRPVIFDVLGPDGETSLLPPGLRMVLHVNPKSMSFSHTKIIQRIQTKGGFVEQHWGDGAGTIQIEASTGGFKRLFSGLSNATGGASDGRGTRRETIAYDKYQDLLSLFHNNGAIFDSKGAIAFHGKIKMTFDGGVYIGFFSSFERAEAAESPFHSICPWRSRSSTRF